MKNKWLVIVLTITLFLSATLTLHAQTISLFSSANMTAVPTGLRIKLEIRGADQNRARLQNQFSNYIQQFKNNLINNSLLTANNVTQSSTINSSYTKDTGYNNPQIYEKKLTFKITISRKDAVKIQNSTEKIIDLIEDNSPSNTRYNSLAELDLTYQKNHYYFAQAQNLQRKIFNNNLQKNKTKSQS